MIHTKPTVSYCFHICCKYCKAGIEGRRQTEIWQNVQHQKKQKRDVTHMARPTWRKQSLLDPWQVQCARSGVPTQRKNKQLRKTLQRRPDLEEQTKRCQISVRCRQLSTEKKSAKNELRQSSQP